MLEQRARALARPAQPERTAGLVSLVLFGIGGVRHAMEARFVREVLRRPPLSTVPAVSGALVGVSNVRGEILPIADISSLLGLTPPRRPAPVIVLEGDEPPVGILVETVHDFEEVPAESIVSAQASAAHVGASTETLMLGLTSEATVLSATSLLSDPRLFTTEPRRG